MTPESRPSWRTSPSEVTPLMTALTRSGMTSMDSVFRNSWPIQATFDAAFSQNQPTSSPAITPMTMKARR